MGEEQKKGPQKNYIQNPPYGKFLDTGLGIFIDLKSIKFTNKYFIFFRPVIVRHFQKNTNLAPRFQ